MPTASYSTFYNDNEKFVCNWMRNLIEAGLISSGVVDERGIEETKPKELGSYTRVHLFAGIAGWDYALHLAGWPDELQVWTGSCPCQPFSVAGKRGGVADRRHLWPQFYRLIRVCRPATVFGEQVSGADGKKWFRGVRFDLEKLGYRVAVADLCAASGGAPHRRQRLWWVADTPESIVRSIAPAGEQQVGKQGEGDVLGVADSTSIRRIERRGGERTAVQGECAEREWKQERSEHLGELSRGSEGSCGVGADGRLGDRAATGLERSAGEGIQGGSGRPAFTSAADIPVGYSLDPRLEGRGLLERGRSRELAAGPPGYWSDYSIVWCRNPAGGPPIPRRVEPGTFPLADGVSARVGRIRGYGNSIVPQVAAAFIRSYMEAVGIR